MLFWDGSSTYRLFPVNKEQKQDVVFTASRCLHHHGCKAERYANSMLRVRGAGNFSIDDLLMGTEHSIKKPWVHGGLSQQIESFDLLCDWGIMAGDRISTLVPNGPRAALCLVVAMRRYCVVPLNPSAPAENIAATLSRLQIRCVISPAGEKIALASQQAGIPHIMMQPKDKDGSFELARSTSSCSLSAHGMHGAPNNHVLVLQTSGTTSEPKSVPFTLQRLIESGRALADSMQLNGSDVGLNVMPLHHVGGIACNVMAPLLSSSSMIYVTWLDASNWYASIENVELAITWCYAAPAMWSQIIPHGESKGCKMHVLRILRSGAAPLPHSSAIRLAALFGEQTCVLPTYSMTECMPIASPPLGYTLARPSSVGLPPHGLHIEIVDVARRFARGYVGEVMLASGPQLFEGYGLPVHHRKNQFPTGDLGFIDVEGWLFLTGRAKEVVNRGGELISPFEVEDVLNLIVRDHEIMVFGVPHSDLGEVVGVAVPTSCDMSLTALRDCARRRLAPNELPQILVSVPALPRTAGTGKLQRAGYAAILGILPVHGDELSTFSVGVDGVKCSQREGLLRAPEPATASGSPSIEVICAIVETLIGLEVDADVHLVEVGIISLTAVRLREQLCADVPLATIFDYPTPRQLAEMLEHATNAPLSIASVNVGDVCMHPTSWNQSQLLTVHAADPESAAYNQPKLRWLLGPFVINAMRIAMSGVIHRHAVLRTTYELDESGGFIQRVHESSDNITREISASSETEAILLVESAMKQRFCLLDGDGSIRTLLVRVDHHSHLLLVNLHHVAMDGWSVSVLYRELGALYRAVNGCGKVHVSELPELSVQYVDYTMWQLTTVLGAQADYWREHLQEGAIPVLELPLDFTRPATQTFQGASTPIAVVPVISLRLKQLSYSYSATLFQMAIALWAVLLCRHAGQDEVVIGSPYHGRDAIGTEKLIGYFVNMLALRVVVSRGEAMACVVRTTRNAATGGMRHAAMPFQQIVHELLPKRSHDASRNAVFQAMLGWGGEVEERNEGLAMNLGDAIEVRTTKRSEHCVAKVEIMLSAHISHSDSIEGIITFNTDLYVSKSLEALSARLAMLAKAAADSSLHEHTWALPLMSPEEAECVLWCWNDTAAKFSVYSCINDLVVAQAAACPDVVALECNGAALSYATLIECASRLASTLSENSVAYENIVALQLERSLEQAVSVLSVLSADGAYLPLEPEWPLERRVFMLKDAACDQIVTKSHLMLVIEPFESTILVLDDVRRAPVTRNARWRATGSRVCESDARRQPLLRKYCISYVYFTSGSTGRPKGVLVPQYGFISLLHALRPLYYRLTDVWRLGLTTSYVFDPFVRKLFLCWVVMGGSCLLLERSELLSGVSGTEANHLGDVPSVISQMKIAPSVKVVDFGGEALTQTAIDAVPTITRANNVYGPTEVTVIATARRIVHEELPLRLTSIGRPLANVLAYVVDGDTGCRMQLCPIGVCGELWLGGIQVARGYLNRPEKTADVFISNSWPGTVTAGCGVVYCTGDRVRWYYSGELDFIGRIDFQVKVRGQRIELGEIEHVLRSQVGVVEALVLLARRNDELVAYVSPASGLGCVTVLQDGLTETIPFQEAPALSRVSDALPAYMVPSLVIGVDDWPRTSSGKIDRSRLPPPTYASARMIVPPRTAEELRVRDVFSDVLNLAAEAISVEASFFELGGNSLRAVALARRLAEAMGLAVSMADVIQRPTITGLASAGDAVLNVPEIKRTCTPYLATEIANVTEMAGTLSSYLEGINLKNYYEDFLSEGYHDLGILLSFDKSELLNILRDDIHLTLEEAQRFVGAAPQTL